VSIRSSRARLIAAGVLAAAGIVIAIVLLTGEDDRDSLEAALAYVPKDAAAAVALETDLNDDQWEAFADTAGRGLLSQIGVGDSETGDPGAGLPPVGGLGDLEATVSAALLAQGINYEGQVKPLLGGELVLASAAPPESLQSNPISGGAGTVWALEVDSTDTARSLLRDQADLEPVGRYEGAELWGSRGDGPVGGDEADEEVAIDGDVIVFAEDFELESDEGGRGALRTAIDTARGNDRMTVEEFEASLDGTPKDALMRVSVNPESYLAIPDLAGLKEVPWPAALRSIGVSASFEGDDAVIDAVAQADSAALSEEDLPFPTETGEPELVRREGEVASGSIDQSFTTAFLLRAARAVFADSAFVRDVAQLEADLGIDFEQEVLRQFAGPSASSVTLDGRFAARSTVADPAAMRSLLPKLAPRLPQIVKDLDRLGTEGLLALLFIAPDAPVATVPLGGATVAQALPGGEPESEEEEQLYVIRAPRGPRGTVPIVALPDQIVFGIIGDTFVVASDRRRAREIAAATAESVEGLSGASVLSAESLGGLPDRVQTFLQLDVSGVRSVQGSIEASLERVSASLTASYD
jgi:hypothetical protein